MPQGRNLMHRLSLLKSTALACAAIPFAVGVAFAADPVPQNDLLNATLWVSNAIEYKANTIAMYQLPRTRLEEALADKKGSATAQTDADAKPPAIIADMDET